MGLYQPAMAVEPLSLWRPMNWTPHVGFETIALDGRYVVHEMFLGGDRGGGKTGSILADYLLNVLEHRDPDDVRKILPGPYRPWKGILFRRTFAEFETLIERSKEVFYGILGDRKQGGRAHFQEGELKWQFYDERGNEYHDVYLQFFHMEHDNDVDRWIGTEWQWVGYDELPQWASPKPYLKMFASMRAAKPGIPIRVRSTGNPGGPGIGWIKERFQIPDGSKEVVARRSGVPIITKDPRTGRELVRMFLLALRQENLTLRRNDPYYEARLAASVEGDPELEKAWIHADFSSLFGAYFKIFNADVHCVDPQDVFPGGVVPAHWKVQGYLDYGENAPTAFGLMASDEFGTHIQVAEYYNAGEYASYHAGAIRDLIKNCPYTQGRTPTVVWGDSQMWYTRANAQAAALDRTVADIFKREAGLHLIPSAKGPGSRVRGWRWIKDLLAWTKDADGNLLRKPRLYCTLECGNLIRELRNAVYSDTGDREDLDKGCSDHALTGLNYFVTGAYRGHVPEQFTKTPRGITMSEVLERQESFEKGRGRRYGIMVGQPMPRFEVPV